MRISVEIKLVAWVVAHLLETGTHSMYSGTSPYGHLTSKKTSPLQSPWLSPKLYSTVQITPCNKVTSALRSLLPSPVGDLNSEVPLYWVQVIYKRVQAANRANIQRLPRQLLQQHTVMIRTILYVPMQTNIGSSIKLICGDLWNWAVCSWWIQDMRRQRILAPQKACD